MAMTIHYKVRETGQLMEEPVAGEKMLRWSCETPAGRTFTGLLGSRKILSVLVGFYQNSRFSRRRLNNFIQEMEINLEEADREKPEMYHSFNDFFARRLKPGARIISANPDRLISPADGRILAYQSVNPGQLWQIKGKSFSLAELLRDSETAKRYKNGCAVIIRLNPSDYHRFHFPVDGIPHEPVVAKGRYFSVNPLSLMMTDRVYCRNKRHLTTIDSLDFGQMVMVEVGAALVGSIVQTFLPEAPVMRGTEKGYFQFGGSTVLLLIQPGQVELDLDLLNNTEEGYETLIKMGEGIGTKTK
ncbi:MAG: archaetidylserine decarboxylase [Bacillota bacterium]|nr:archaetidylserine decarboxylase [Bacillota bacterium]MDW7677579.1 archaetidylserine decarboxylase [Bacillota bacterium]